MENISQEQLWAFGALGIAIIGVALLVCLAIMAGTFKLSIAWLGKASPSYLACVGWLLAITFVNCFLVFGAMIVLGDTAVMMVTPLTWFVTLYMVSNAANCGLFRAFGIWFVNSLLSSIGMMVVVFAVSIPLAVISAGANSTADPLQEEFEKMDAMVAEINSQTEDIGATQLPEIQEVRFQPPQEMVPPAESITPAKQVSLPVESIERAEATQATQQRRASDGSVINPFFQD